jgi:hypothetical protein
MSQSDYIQHKKLSVILSNVSDLPGTISSDDYVACKTYSLEHTVFSTKPTYNQMILPPNQRVFGMEIDVSKCILNPFPFCQNTESRVNRRLNSKNSQFNPSKKHNGQNEFFLYQKFNNLLCYKGEFRECDEFIYKRGPRFE